MKIAVYRSGAKPVTVTLPNAMLFSPMVLKLVLGFSSRKGRKMPDIPPVVIDRLCAAIKTVSREKGPWELVRVDSANGGTVVITI